MPAEDPTARRLAQAITEVSEKASLLVREEIELAKAEITARLTKLVRGAVAGIVAGIFFILALLYLLDALAWGFWSITGWDSQYWIGFLFVALLLILLGALGGALAYKALKAGAPPTPEQAIDEARKIKETVQSSISGDDDRPSIGGAS